jgi:hypothetical protein
VNGVLTLPTVLTADGEYELEEKEGKGFGKKANESTKVRY